MKVCSFVTAILISLISEKIGTIQTSGSILLAVNCCAAFYFFFNTEWAVTGIQDTSFDLQRLL